MALGRQTWTLIVKNLTIAAVRNGLSTIIRAFFLPFILILFISNARHIFTPPQQYGIGVATPVRNLTNSFQATTDGRRTLVFVNSGYQNGEIARVIETVAAPARAQNMDVQIIQQESTLLGICRGSLSGVGPCFGAAVFHSSPSEPSSGGQWNYTLHMDDVLGRTIFTNQVDNPAEIYLIPLQQAIDFAIAGVDQTGQATPSMAVDEYPYTMLTEAQWNDQNRVSFMDTVINLLGAAFFAGMVGVSYQLVGFMVSEREMGMTQLLEAMMPNTRTWQPQFARLASLHVAYSLMYLPGWIIIGVLLGLEVFTNTSMAIVIVYHFLAGLALTSFSIFGAAFFKKAQMSGNSVTMIMLLLAILAQVVAKSTSDVAIGVLGLVFPPMNYIFFLVLMARWERQDIGTNLVQTAPGNPWSLPGVALWVFLAVQIILYPILGALVERSLHGISTKGRSVTMDARDNDRVRLRRFSKRFQPSWFSRLISPLSGSRRETVVAVNDVSFTAQKGQILVLLGANGSGKTTILNAITGLTNISQGNVKVGTRDGIGYTPQKNVLWEELTVEEHVTIFNRIKSTDKIASKETIRALIKTCDIESKLEAMSKTLSGGQKRKLQLAMMFTGGSSVCCVDEVTSGLDPLSRRKVWDILLAERGRRTIIMTTHFLDEAGLLADHIVILSKGSLCVEGSAVDLTNALGGGYRVLVETSSGGPVAPHFSDVPRTDAHGLATYSVPDSAAAAELIRRLDARGVAEFEVKGPTIEDVFLNIADTTGALTSPQKHIGRPRLLSTSKGSSDVQTTESNDSEDQGLVLSHGKRIGVGRQAWVLLQKRLTVLRRNGMPHLFAFIVPIIAAGLVTLLLRGYSDPGCSLAELAQPATTMSFTTEDSVEFVVGPSSKFTGDALSSLQNLITGNSASGHNRTINLVNTRAEFQAYISLNSSTVSPGGFFIDDLPIFAYEGSDGIYKAMLVQNALDTQLTNTSIAAQYASFDVLVAPNSIDVLQLVIYFGLVMAICPAFFALYPTFERLQGIRGLEYSNGIRPLPLWLAYLFFDFAISVVMSGIIVGIFVATSSVWYNIGYLFLVLVLYSTVSILLSYIVSKIATSQLAAFATMASLQSLMFTVYIGAYLSIITRASVGNVDSILQIVHFSISVVTPVGSLIRALFVALNIFATSCNDDAFASNPGALTLYGGPIIYLIVQSLVLFLILVYWDSGKSFLSCSRRSSNTSGPENAMTSNDKTSSTETESTDNIIKSSDPIQVLSLRKTYNKYVALDSISLSVRRSEVFALLGPNGAGKSTAVSLIRGDLSPDSRHGGDALVENQSVLNHRAAARTHMGVCPQFDAMDDMTVLEHLVFYAKVRGVSDVHHNVTAIIRAVGLGEFTYRMATKLSGGNKRKLSLAIALVGNPTVLLLDEPSSGMDAIAKRIMWRSLTSVIPGRSLLLTTHSMEEAAALAGRVGILAQRMLAVGEIPTLRRKAGIRYQVHVVMKNAPWTEQGEMQRLRQWLQMNLPGVEIEPRIFHGQMRFTVPMTAPVASLNSSPLAKDRIRGSNKPHENGIAVLFRLLEDNKEQLGLQGYSVNLTTLDQVFLGIVERNNVQEEGVGVPHELVGKEWWRLRWSWT